MSEQTLTSEVPEFFKRKRLRGQSTQYIQTLFVLWTWLSDWTEGYYKKYYWFNFLQEAQLSLQLTSRVPIIYMHDTCGITNTWPVVWYNRNNKITNNDRSLFNLTQSNIPKTFKLGTKERDFSPFLMIKLWDISLKTTSIQLYLPHWKKQSDIVVDKWQRQVRESGSFLALIPGTS